MLMALVSYGANDRKSKSSTDTASALATPLVHHFDVHYLEGFFFFKIFIYLVERVTERRGERKWIFYLLVHYTNDCIH